MKKFLLLLLLLAVSLILYISISFYHIEHKPSSHGSILMTKQNQLEHCLNDNAIAFDNAANIIIADNTDTHDYYLKDMVQTDDIITLQDNCNIEWVRINANRDYITFYQTSQSKQDNQIILSYVCQINSHGEKTWYITDDFPDTNSKETLGVKIYNMLFNRDVV